MNNKKVLITGAAGFIGFHLAQALASRGNGVICIDNFNSYYSPLLKRQRADHLLKQGIEVLEQDICDTAALENLIQTHQPTHIVHLAAQAGVRYSLVNPQAYIKANVEGFVNILELCRQHSEIQLVYASSSSIYGRNEKIPFSLNDRTDNPASLYGATKKMNELLADTYHHLYGISNTGLRFFTVYGPWGRPDMAYFSFTKAILAGEPIELYQNGTLRRDFTYIDDIVSGIMAAIDLEAKNALFNLGNCSPIEVNHLVATLEQLLGKKANKHFLPMQLGDVTETFADITASQEQLNYHPKTSIEEGLKKFVAWYLQNTGSQDSTIAANSCK